MSFFGKYYFNFRPYKPERFFANWNLEFYKRFSFDDIISLDSVENEPVQFALTREVIRKTSYKLKRKIHLVITAVGTGSIVDIIQNNCQELKEYIEKITLTDLREIDLTRWDKLSRSGIRLTAKTGNILNPDFIKTLTGDMFYGNELFGDLPIHFIYKKNNKIYDFWLRIFTANPLPKQIHQGLKNSLQKIYKEGRFPGTFTPEIGKIFKFDIAFKKRILNLEMEIFHELYPDDCILAVSEKASEVLQNLYEQIPVKGLLLFHDYGFFSRENLHLIRNFLRKDNNNQFVRNYYGEFTTDPCFDYAYHKLKPLVENIRIKKTVDRLEKIINIPKELINLDGKPRQAEFFIGLIRDRLISWQLAAPPELDQIVSDYVESLKQKNADLELTISSINIMQQKQFTEDQLLTLKKILLGYFNDDDHRFLTIEITK